MNIIAISYSYPSVSKPFHGIFVQNLMKEIANQGHKVTVIAPQSVHSRDQTPLFNQEEDIRIYRPKFLSLGSAQCCGVSFYFLTQFFFNKAVMRVVKREKNVADVVYSHFFLASGAAALEVGQFLKIPVFCTLGEDSLDVYESKYSINILRQLYAKFDGFFINSTHTKEFAIERYGILEAKCVVVPNGIDTAVFYPRDKNEARKKLNLPLDEKIVVFVGSFIERKGPLRVLAACNQLKNIPKMIFIGTGPQKPEGKNVLFSNTVEHALLPDYLSASDVFVLPTLSEGMSNAILEAVACGVPVVTSPISSNKNFLGEDYGLFSDPLDIYAISKKIEKVFQGESAIVVTVPSLRERANTILATLEDSSK